MQQHGGNLLMSQTCSIKLCQRGSGGGGGSVACTVLHITMKKSLQHGFFVNETVNCRSIISAEPHHEKTGFLPKRKQRQRSAVQF